MRLLIGIVACVLFYVAALQAKEFVVRSEKTAAATLDPQDPAWQKAKLVEIPLIPQSFVAPHGGGATPSVEVRSLRTDDHIFLRLSWEDKTRSAKLSPSGRFTDACAVEFPLGAGMPSPFMGEKGGPVHIWMWQAVAQETNRYDKAYADFYRSGAIEETIKFPGKPVQNLLAEGFGTLATHPVQDVEGKGVWENGRWSVVFRRPLRSSGGTQFKAGLAIPIAFAVWDGDSSERDGAKSLSFWHALRIGPGEVQPGATIARGQRVFARYGCATCHGPGGKGGVKNSNAQGGQVPPIHRVQEGFSEEELKKVIWEGRTSVPEDARWPRPPLRMNAWKAVMDENELDDLVKYLFSLMPKEKGEEW